MPQPDSNSLPQDAELTPEAERVMARARRSFGMSMLVLLLGFIAIGGALVYRATKDDGGVSARYALQSVNMPAGAELVSTSVAEGLVTVSFRIEDRMAARIFDGKTGELVGEFTIGVE